MTAAARLAPTKGEELILEGVRLRRAVEAIYRLDGPLTALKALDRAKSDFIGMHPDDPKLTGWIA